METTRSNDIKREVPESAPLEDTADEQPETPPPQTWKHPDDGKSLSEKDEEIPLKP